MKHAEVLGEDANAGQQAGEDLRLAPDPVEVRRNAGLSGFVGATAAAVGIAYLNRAATTGAALDWVLAALMAVLAVGYLRSFVDARTPLLVADGQGVRLRLGRTWRGLPWGALADVTHQPREGLRDGRLVLAPRNTARVVAELDAPGRRRAALSSRVYGDPFVVPLGLATRVRHGDRDLTLALRLLAADRAPVHEVPRRSRSERVEHAEPGPPADDLALAAGTRSRPLPDPRPTIAHWIDRVAGVLVRRPARADGADATDATEAVGDASPDSPLVASATPSPLRDPRTARRSEVTRDVVLPDSDSDAGDGVGADDRVPRELRRPGSVSLVEDTVAWGDRVRPIAQPGQPVEPLVFEDDDVEPAADPVIGPELAAARTRLALTVDQLAERTRIRPHVVESIEVDDFVPCGGDFYARGHLRTLARVLGVDAAPLLETYDERYADAPISPRRVFEAELATGVNGTIRSTRGGANWSLLVGAVMALVLAWSIARLVMDEPTPLQKQPLQLNGSPVVVPREPARLISEPVPVKLVGFGPAHVVVRDATGEVVYSGDLVAGQRARLDVEPPVQVRASAGRAVGVVVDGDRRGRVGRTATVETRTFEVE